jgi:undecaprenyl diphosphate synthase
MQSRIADADALRAHVAIVMDGNGRWATRRGLPRTAGHAAGITALRRTMEAAPALGVKTLTVFAFSADNWRRPVTEVDALMTMLETYLARDIHRLVDAGVRLSVIGRRDRLPNKLCDAIDHAQQATRDGTKLWLRVAIDYSARDAILLAAQTSRGNTLTREDLGRALGGGEASRDVDLLIRTGGEKRLSDFLLWECAYAELYFTDVMWPAFGADDLAIAMADFRRRNRRFGGLTPSAACPAQAA